MVGSLHSIGTLAELPAYQTGDIIANFNLLKRNLIKVGYNQTFDNDKILHGNIIELCSIYNWLLTQYDNRLTDYILSHNYLIQSTNNTRFIENIYKICRELLHIYPSISPAQYCTLTGYAEHKLILLSLFTVRCYQLHQMFIQQKHNNRRKSVHQVSNRLYTPAKTNTSFSQRPSTSKRPVSASKNNSTIRRMSQSVMDHNNNKNSIHNQQNAILNHNSIVKPVIDAARTYSISPHPQYMQPTNIITNPSHSLNQFTDNDDQHDETILPHIQHNNITPITHDSTIHLLSSKLDDVLSRVLTTLDSINSRVTALEQRLDDISIQQHQPTILNDSTNQFVNQINQRLQSAQQQLNNVKSIPAQ